MRLHGIFTSVVKVWKDISTIPPVRDIVYWFYEYYGVGHPIVKEEVKFLTYSHLRAWLTGEAHIPLDPPLSMSLHIRPATLQEMRQTEFLDCEQFVVGEERENCASYWAEQIFEVGHLLTDSQRMGNIDLFRPTALWAGITPVVVTLASVHSLSQDFSLPSEPKGPDPEWHIVWIERRKMLPIHRLRDPPPMSLSYSAEEQWHLDSVDYQLYSHGLRLRRGRDVQVVLLAPGGGSRRRQCGSGPRTRGGDTSRRGWGTGDDYE
ncbi:hypothetical protein GIB67_009726 [Kingdonia uniflora]|uniref:Uncharacterized protein n=1 Tax=Kingdonia uniflora TaxID=39325 RepID=A0A7J7LBE7_9MAGN|nr:hypothetical protein GIB67_009726 [Kingdonia uniflora]